MCGVRVNFGAIKIFDFSTTALNYEILRSDLLQFAFPWHFKPPCIMLENIIVIWLDDLGVGELRRSAELWRHSGFYPFDNFSKC